MIKLSKMPLKVSEKVELIQNHGRELYELGYSEGYEVAQKELEEVLRSTIPNTKNLKSLCAEIRNAIARCSDSRKKLIWIEDILSKWEK